MSYITEGLAQNREKFESSPNPREAKMDWLWGRTGDLEHNEAIKKIIFNCFDPANPDWKTATAKISRTDHESRVEDAAIARASRNSPAQLERRAELEASGILSDVWHPNHTQAVVENLATYAPQNKDEI